MEFKLPEVGENIESGTIVSILVSEGDQVKKDQDLLEIETDKASLPVPSPTDGKITKINIKEGDDVKIGQVVMTIEEGSSSEPKSAKKDETTKTAKMDVPPSPPAGKTTDQGKKAPAQQAAAKPAPAAQSTPAARPQAAQKDVAAAPSVRRLAREIGVNVGDIPGTGPGGRITKDDVKSYSKQLHQSSGGAVSVQKPLPDFSKWGEIDRQPMSKIRQVTAEHMTHCWSTVPHVTQFGKADITDLEKLRKRYSKPDRKLTVTPFLLKVMASALKLFPQFNASIDTQSNTIIYKKYIHVGVAVDTDRGLLVPVIRDVDQKSIYQINDELNEAAERARSKKIGLDELKGGSITLTNLGGIFGTSFTPIVNWPEVAILGVSRGAWEPVYEGNQFVPRFLLPLSLSYDHRLIDGADGARFLKWICDAIEQPLMMELEA